jgi:uncharacterized membrane protein YjgN (DUF898 family)
MAESPGMTENENASTAPQPAVSNTTQNVSGPDDRPTVLFDGPRSALFWLLVRNFLLTIVTIGIYRFWAKTRVRKFFWRNTKLLGEPLEYLGTGGELFVGFLIAIVILVPFGALYSLLQFFTIGLDGNISLIVDVIYYAIIGFLIQFAIYRARRYRLTRTSWRGIRFGLDGSSLRYAIISFGYTLLSFATLSLADPWQRVATIRYFINHARFGNTPLSLDITARWLFPRWVIVAIPFGTSIALLVALNWSTYGEMLALDAQAQQGADVNDELLAVFSNFVYWPVTLTVIGIVANIWYSVVEFRYLIGNISLGAATLTSELAPAFVYRVYILFWLAFIAIAGLLGYFVMDFSGGLFAGDQMKAADIAGFVVIFVYFFLYGALKTLFVDITLLKRVCATLSGENTEDLNTAVQSSADMPGHGEGLADALDVGGF